MNNSYISYKNYVESTAYYKKICEAIKLSSELAKNIENLINALGRDNGELITSAIEELEYFKKGAEFLVNDYTSRKDKILANANTYDTKFNSLKSMIGNIDKYSINNDKQRKEEIKSVTIDENTGYIRVEKEVTISPKLDYTYDPITKKYYLVPKDSFTLALSSILGKSTDEKYNVVELYNLNGRVSEKSKNM